MKDATEKEQARAAEGKRKPIARNPNVEREQNGEVEPLESTARKQKGTDEHDRKN